jgi:hypothetical protein
MPRIRASLDVARALLAADNADDRVARQAGTMIQNESYTLRRVGCLGSVTTVIIRRSRKEAKLVADERSHALRRRTGKNLTPEEWAAFERQLAAADFWNLPEQHDRIGLDGETWTIEGRRGPRTHRSSCWSPHEGAYYDLGRCFLDLAEAQPLDDAP